MRRKEREITDQTTLLEIMKHCDVCSVAFHSEPYPYVIPLNFGVEYTDQFTLYFHGAGSGTKIDLLNQNPLVAFEMNCSREFIDDPQACKATMHYRSVCGNGMLKIVEQAEKERALTILMEHYGHQNPMFDDPMLASITVLKLEVHHIWGKQH